MVANRNSSRTPVSPRNLSRVSPRFHFSSPNLVSIFLRSLADRRSILPDAG